MNQHIRSNMPLYTRIFWVRSYLSKNQSNHSNTASYTRTFWVRSVDTTQVLNTCLSHTWHNIQGPNPTTLTQLLTRKLFGLYSNDYGLIICYILILLATPIQAGFKRSDAHNLPFSNKIKVFSDQSLIARHHVQFHINKK